MVGKNLSHYKILDELGRGGMGIVYKAEDTKLDRTVAIKVLPSAALASDDDRARFYREAKAAAQLHHPHIASVFEIDEAVSSDAPHGTEPSPFISMEYIEGETLSDRIQKGPLKLEEAVRIASQIASGLEAAHEKDIVHRDLKSQNVMLTKKGEAKILDFGLAQTAASTKLTRMGSTMGTVAYMSPEQARGEEVDLRTDLWSLGVVLYEMVSGKSPFPGDYEQAVVYEILNTVPEPLTSLRTGVPMKLEWLAGKLLAKNADERYQSSAGLLVDLKTIETLAKSGQTSNITSLPSTAPSNLPEIATHSVGLKWLSTPIRAITVISVAILLTFFLTKHFTGSIAGTGSADVKFLISNTFPSGTTFSILPRHFSVSSDGKLIAFVARAEGENHLYVRRMNDASAQLIPESYDAQSPFFSPDGRWIGFFVNQVLKKVLVDGGTPELITNQTGPTEGGVSQPGTWDVNDNIYIKYGTGIARLPASGGDPDLVVTPDSGSGLEYNYPVLLPGEGDLLISVRDQASGSSRVANVSLDSGSVEIVLDEEAYGAKYANSGHLVFNRSGHLFTALYNLRTHSVVSAPILVPGDYLTGGGRFGYDFSNSGLFVSVVSSSIGETPSEVMWLDANGTIVEEGVPPIVGEGEQLGYYRISPAGDRILYADEGDLWIYDIESEQRLPFADNSAGPSAWSNDGLYIAFSNTNSGLSIKRTDFSESERLIYESETRPFVTSWSLDNQTIVFYFITETQRRDIWTMDIESGIATPFLATSANERSADFSNDGKWIAYASDESGQDEIYVDSFPERRIRVQVSLNGGREPVWSPDGERLYYRVGTRLMQVDMNLRSTVTVLDTQELFAGPFYAARNVSGFDIHPDGDRFLMAKEGGSQFGNTLAVELDWFEKLKSIEFDEK